MKDYKKQFKDKFYLLAQKYYGTKDLTTLTPYQLEKLTYWVTAVNPETRAKQKGRKYSGNTYKKLKGIYN